MRIIRIWPVDNLWITCG